MFNKQLIMTLGLGILPQFTVAQAAEKHELVKQLENTTIITPEINSRIGHVIWMFYSGMTLDRFETSEKIKTFIDKDFLAKSSRMGTVIAILDHPKTGIAGGFDFSRHVHYILTGKFKPA